MAMIPADAPSNPPRDYFSVWQRLLRGYGPLAVLVVLLLLMSWLVPSKVQSTTNASTSKANGNSPTGPTGNTISTATTVPGAANNPGGSTTNTAAAGGAPEAGAAGVSQCTGDQVQGDPYSPPCIQFSGDNGGATATGVNATEIHVSYRVLNEKGFQQTLAQLAGASLVDTPETITNTVKALAEYFNKNFQFYGRHIVFDFYNGVGSNTQELLGGGVDKAEADADTAQSLGVFADLSATSEPYGDALAKRQIIGFGVPYLSREWMSQRAPYSWSLATDCSIVTEEVSDYALKKLFDKPAANAGPGIQGKPRVITAIAPDNSWYQECVNAGRAILRQSGRDWQVEPIQYQLDLGTMSNQAQNIVPKLQSEGVTTIVCGCDPIFPVFFSGVAARAGYFPEFINIGVALDDADIVGQLWNQDFTKHSFGISALGDDANQPPQTSLGYAAYRTVRQDQPAFSVDLIYYQMYMLATGLQMAGPNLTPQTFQDGMFAYPKKLGPAGLWGYGPGDYTPQDDVREIYWNPTQPSPYNGKPGTWVDPNPGQRYPKGNITPGDPAWCQC
jgi:hypothetical protein